MSQIKTYLNDKYLRIEIAFFLFYYFLFNILTSIEYNLVEPHIRQYPNPLNLANHFVFALVKIIPVWILYKVLIQKYLFNKRYLKFLLLMVVYLVLLNFYNLYINWLIAQLRFLPKSVIEEASATYKADVLIHYGGTMYMLREYMVLAFLAYFIRSAKQDEQMNELKQRQLNAELNYLKVQLQPHFFFNTLNNIYSLALQQSAQTAPLVAKHAEMMRYILYNSPNQLVKLHEEVNFLKNYTEVEAVRYPKSIGVTFEIQGIKNTSLIEPLLLLPFIENTFKHGVREEVNSGFVKIVICQIENELTLETKNTKAIVKNDDGATPGIGLENVKKRLAILYPDRHQLEIKEDESVYEVYLSIILN
jgi:sensor histidine kinase YesM